MAIARRNHGTTAPPDPPGGEAQVRAEWRLWVQRARKRTKARLDTESAANPRRGPGQSTLYRQITIRSTPREHAGRPGPGALDSPHHSRRAARVPRTHEERTHGRERRWTRPRAEGEAVRQLDLAGRVQLDAVGRLAADRELERLVLTQHHRVGPALRAHPPITALVVRISLRPYRQEDPSQDGDQERQYRSPPCLERGTHERDLQHRNTRRPAPSTKNAGSRQLGHKQT